MTHHDRGGGETGEIALPELCSVVGLDGTRDEPLAFLQIEGFTRPASLFRWDGGTSLVPHGRADGPSVFETAFAVTHETYPSPDGTEIGLFTVHRDDEPPDVDTPCILTGYGGFAIAETPAWSPTIAAWAEAGGLFAVAGLRGGYEEGEAWHQAGRRRAQAERVRRLPRRGRPSGRPRAGPPAIGWPSGAVRTAACWWAPRSRSVPTCAAPSTARCRCWTWCATRSS